MVCKRSPRAVSSPTGLTDKLDDQELPYGLDEGVDQGLWPIAGAPEAPGARGQRVPGQGQGEGAVQLPPEDLGADAAADGRPKEVLFWRGSFSGRRCCCRWAQR